MNSATLTGLVLALSSAGLAEPISHAARVKTCADSMVANCYAFPLLAQLPVGPFRVHDSYPMPYTVTSPCHNLSTEQATDAGCTSFNDGDSAGSPVYAMAGAGNSTCYALGHLRDGPSTSRGVDRL